MKVKKTKQKTLSILCHFHFKMILIQNVFLIPDPLPPHHSCQSSHRKWKRGSESATRIIKSGGWPRRSVHVPSNHIQCYRLLRVDFDKLGDWHFSLHCTVPFSKWHYNTRTKEGLNGCKRYCIEAKFAFTILYSCLSLEMDFVKVQERTKTKNKRRSTDG